MLSRLGHRETGAELDRESAATTLFSQSLVGKESILKRSLNGRLIWPFRERGAQHKLDY